MKKIIIALDGEHFPKGAFEFAKYLNTKSEILLAGVFLSPIDYSRLMAYTGTGEGLAIMPEWLMKNDDEEVINKNIKLFEDACIAGGLHYRVHKDNDMMALSSLVEETRFADVLLVSSELFFKNVQPKQPNFYLEEVLKRAECPVMMVPENFAAPTQVVLSYDGGESSTFAIKQFAYLFPELITEETILLSVTDDAAEGLPDYSMVSELLANHYPNLKMKTLAVKNKHYFVDWLNEQPVSFVVMGAFSRGIFSTIFRKSFAKDVIQEVSMPLFIAHK